MSAVLTLLALDGGLRLVWAGDYADPDPGHQANLYFLVEDRHFVRFDGLVADGVAPNTPLGEAAASAREVTCATSTSANTSPTPICMPTTPGGGAHRCLR